MEENRGEPAFVFFVFFVFFVVFVANCQLRFLHADQFRIEGRPKNAQGLTAKKSWPQRTQRAQRRN